MNNKTTVRKYSSPSISALLSEITPVEKIQTNTKMVLAARLDDLISSRGWGKGEFAQKVNKNPSEITKWLSGTQNFTIDTLSEIACVFNIPVAALLAPKEVQVINKMQVTISVKEARPGIQYVTLYESPLRGSPYHYSGTPGPGRLPLTSFVEAQMMSPINDKGLTVDLQLKSIELLKSSLTVPSSPEVSLTNFNFNINLETKADSNNKLLLVIVSVEIRSDNQDHILGSLVSSCIYGISNFDEIITIEPGGKLHIPPSLSDMLNAFSISTTRGIMFSAYKGTFLHNALLPVIDPVSLEPVVVQEA